MPTKRTALPGGRGVRWRHQFATGDLELDLTSERSDLSDGQASVVIGRDVVNRNRLAKAPGRKPVEIVTGIPVADQPLTTAIESDFHGRMITFHDFASGERQAGEYLWQFIKFIDDSSSFRSLFPDHYAVFELTDEGQDRWGAFSQDMVGELVQFLPASFVRPKRVVEVIPTGPAYGNSSIVLDRTDWATRVSPTPGWRPEEMFDEFGAFGGFYHKGFEIKIAISRFHDKRGIWVSNGQKFWLLQGGIYTLYLDLGDDSGTKGLAWRGAQISPWVFIFTSAHHPPRIISLESPADPGTTEAELSRSLSGLLPPDTASVKEKGGLIMREFLDGQSTISSADQFFSSSTEGITTPSDGARPESVFRVRARVVDERTGATSAFAEVYSSATVRNDTAINLPFNLDATSFDTFIAVDLAEPNAQEDFSPFLPFKSTRSTTVEFWRTRSDGVVFFKEMAKQLVWVQKGDLSVAFESLGNVVDKGLGTKLEDQITRFGGRQAALGMSDVELLFQQQLFERDLRTGGLPPVCVDIAAVDGATIAGGEGDKLTIDIQDKTFEWPRVGSGQIIAHSELNALTPMPESFHPLDFRRLSRSTDTFQRFAVSGDAIIAVMRRGAHRIERVGAFLSVRQLADSGVGTPWPDTVLSVGTRAAWVTPTGIRVYDSDADEGRGELSLLKAKGMQAWLAEAAKFDMDVDAGYDESRGTIHIRRHLTLTDKQAGIPRDLSGSGGRVDEGVGAPFVAETNRHLVDSAMVNLSTGQWTLIEDDTGFRYVNATHAEASPKASPSLYSVDETGGVFQESYEGDSHPYDSLVVQDSIGGLFTIQNRNRLTGPGGSFSSVMTGDVIRFFGGTFGRSGRARRIKIANESALEFDNLPISAIGPGGPLETERFVIGASRFRIRWAPFQGSSPQTDKTLESLAIAAKPGRRHSVNTAWPDPPNRRLTVSVYRNLGDSALSEDVAGVSIYGDEHVEFKTEDRHSNVEADGNQLEIEIEQLDARTDVVLSSIEARVREDGTEDGDASTES